MLHDFQFGDEMSIKEILDRINPKFIDKVILTGGDPLWSPLAALDLIQAIRRTYPLTKIWLYTGFTREEIAEDGLMEECFNRCDVVITDRFIEGLPKTALTGSNNQRIWGLKKEEGLNNATTRQ